MAFSYKKTGHDVTSTNRIETGTFANSSGSTGGSIPVSLKSANFVSVTPCTSAAFSNGVLTIVTAASASGWWEVRGA